jgi:hypothetical protein
VIQRVTFQPKNGRHLVLRIVHSLWKCAIALMDKKEALEAEDEDKAEDAAMKLLDGQLL